MVHTFSGKLCVLLETYYPVVGGGESEALLLNKALTEKGFQVLVITRRSEINFKKSEVIDGIHVERIAPKGPGSLKRWPMVVVSMYHLIKNVKKYDHIFVPGFRALGISAILVSKIFRKVCIVKAENIGEMSGEFFYRGLEQISLNKNFLLFRIFLKIRNVLIKKADAFISLSSEITSEFKNSGIGRDKIFEIPNPVDQDIFYKVDDKEKKRLRTKLNFPLNKRILIYTGRLVLEKGLPFLLKFWNEIQKNNDDLFLVVVGSGGNSAYSCEDEIKEYVKENKLENSVIFTGNVNVKSVHEYLKSADIFIFPTERGEGLPNSVLEAMACGLVIVTNPVSGIADVIKNNVNGFLMEAGNIEQYCNHLDMLNKDDRLLNEISRNAVMTISEKYSKSIVVQSYIDLFNKF